MDEELIVEDESFVTDKQEIKERKPNGNGGAILATLTQLAGLIDQENLFHFQQGFKQGAAGLAYLLGQGQPLEEALATCQQDMPHITL